MWKILPAHIYRLFNIVSQFGRSELIIRTVSACVASWGLIASMQSMAFSFASLLILRAALGVGEAAFVGVPFFLSFFYRRDELAFRTGLFISAAPLSTSLASSLAWLITKIGNRIPIADWRLLFLVEGFPSILVSVFVFLYIPDNPETARYLTRREKKVAKLRLRKEVAGNDFGKGGLKWTEIREALIDPKSYLTAVWSANGKSGCMLTVSAGNVLLLKCGFQLLAGFSSNNYQRDG